MYRRQKEGCKGKPKSTNGKCGDSKTDYAFPFLAAKIAVCRTECARQPCGQVDRKKIILATLRYFFLPGLAQKGNPRGRRPIKSGKHIPMGLFIHKIKDYETTDYRKYQQACGNPGTGYRNTYADRQRYHAYRYYCNAPAHRRNHRISFQSSSTDCKDSIYLFHCRTPVFLTNKTYRYENKYMYIFCSCHAGCMATE